MCISGDYDRRWSLQAVTDLSRRFEVAATASLRRLEDVHERAVACALELEGAPHPALRHTRQESP